MYRFIDVDNDNVTTNEDYINICIHRKKRNISTESIVERCVIKTISNVLLSVYMENQSQHDMHAFYSSYICHSYQLLRSINDSWLIVLVFFKEYASYLPTEVSFSIVDRCSFFFYESTSTRALNNNNESMQNEEKNIVKIREKGEKACLRCNITITNEAVGLLIHAKRKKKERKSWVHDKKDVLKNKYRNGFFNNQTTDYFFESNSLTIFFLKLPIKFS